MRAITGTRRRSASLRLGASESICEAMRFVAPFLLLAAGASLASACFGDNERGASIELTVPEEMDGGDSVDLTVAFQAEPGAQYSVAVDGEAGFFSPQNKVGVTDAEGGGAFMTRYTAENKTGPVELTANFIGPGGINETVRERVSVFEVERIGNVAPITITVDELDYLTAYPLDLPAGTLRKLAIVAPKPASALIGLYNNVSSIDGDAPGAALVRTPATLVAGANEIVVPAQPITPGKYWMVVVYDGLTTTARGAATVVGRTIDGYRFSDGLPDTMPATTLTTNMGKRNFYIVLRK